MSTIADLVVTLSADIADFRSGMDQANASLSNIKQQSSDAGSALKELATVFEGVVSVEGIRRIADFGASLIESAAKLENVTKALGVDAEAYQQMQQAAQKAGVENDTFARSMETLSRNIDLVATGGAPNVAKVFAQLGLSVTNADGTLRSAADVLEDLSHDKIFQAESQTQKLAQAMIILGGRSGEAGLMVNALGTDFDKARAQANTLDDATLKTAHDLEDKWENAKTAVDNFFTRMIVGAASLPIIRDALMLEPPSPTKAPAPGATPPGPPVVDPTQAKQLTSFREEYERLLQTYQDDANYQARLQAAYQQSADAVRQLEVQHAGEEAAEKAIAAAQRDHVAISTQEIEAVYALAASSKQAALASEEQRQATDALANQQKDYETKVREVMDATDGLSKKNNELADTLGILEQQYMQGAFSLAEYEQRAQAAQAALSSGGDKGMKEFTSGLSSDLSGLIGKMTDFSTIMETADKKGGASVFQQLTQDANEFTKSLGELLLKLLIINPLLNELGLGDQGNGKQLPTLYGNSSSSVSSGISLSGILGKLGSILGLGGTPANLETMAFAQGGDFTVAGSGGTDSQHVSFLASPGERVSVTPQMHAPSAGAGGGGGRGGDININMPISGVHSDSFKASKNQIIGDIFRALSAGRRYG
jgi:hypothetical protein